MTRSVLPGLGALTASTALALALLPLPAWGDSSSLYQGPPPRPGPEILYAPPPVAPQLQNTGIWKAPPILVSGASAYRDGEFLYQGWLYDDHGAKAPEDDPTDPHSAPGGSRTSGDLWSKPEGTYTYPTNTVLYHNNAANLVELRIKPLADATAFRITLNSLTDPSLVGATIAIGDTPSLPTIAIGGTPGVSAPWPYGANVSAPAQYFLTWHGDTATLLDADGARVSGPAPSVQVDIARRQIQLEVPHSEWNPTGLVVRFAAGVGLWDTANNAYLMPGYIATATNPGGAGGLVTPPALFDVAFRFNAQEPQTRPGVSTLTNHEGWREYAQANALASNDIGDFYADVDFRKLAAHVNDNMPNAPQGVPTTGSFDPIFASHFSVAQGEDYSNACANISHCTGELAGQLQPYNIYVPSTPMPSGGWGLTLLLHSLTENHNQFANSLNQSQFANRPPGSIVITPTGRGTDGWCYDVAGADAFEAWAEVARHYKLNPNYTDIAGYSMGGYCTYKFATQYPDLFAKAQPTVGPPALGIWAAPEPPTGGQSSNTNAMLGSVRNIPFLIWVAVDDDLVPYSGAQTQADSFASLGYRYEFDAFVAPPADQTHTALALNDEYQPAADFLGSDLVDRNPAHLTYVYNPTMDFPKDGTTANHAYWISNIVLQNFSGPNPLGTIDVRSEGFGTGDPRPSGVKAGAGALMGGQLGPMAYTSQTQTWAPVPATPVVNRLDIATTNIKSITINAARARVTCNAQLHFLSADHPQVRLTGCPSPRACTSARRVTITLPRATTRVGRIMLAAGRVHRRLRAHHRHVVVNLHGLRAETVRITIHLRVHGRLRIERHTYQTCGTTQRASERLTRSPPPRT